MVALWIFVTLNLNGADWNYNANDIFIAGVAIVIVSFPLDLVLDNVAPLFD